MIGWDMIGSLSGKDESFEWLDEAMSLFFLLLDEFFCLFSLYLFSFSSQQAR